MKLIVNNLKKAFVGLEYDMGKTIGQILKELQKLTTTEEANRYLISSLLKNPHSWSDIKYITGYLGNVERNRILKLFSVE